jgi:hypothetical protein
MCVVYIGRIAQIVEHISNVDLELGILFYIFACSSNQFMYANWVG